jgi:hypothetical protein
MSAVSCSAAAATPWAAMLLAPPAAATLLASSEPARDLARLALRCTAGASAAARLLPTPKVLHVLDRRTGSAQAQVPLHICLAGRLLPGLAPAAGHCGPGPVLALPPMLLGSATQALLLRGLPLGL